MTSPPVLGIVGPSGSGKSSVVRLLASRGVLEVHPTWTTRPRRADEVDGSLEHRFVSEDEFDALGDAGFFLDTVSLFGLPYRYGLPSITRSTDGRVDTIMLRAPLVDRFDRLFPNNVVFQVEDLPERAAARLRARGGTPGELQARLADNEREVAVGRVLAHRVFVNDGTLDELADAIASALTALEVSA